MIFEVREQRASPSGLIVCARADGDIVEATFLMRKRAPRGWTDCLVRIWMHPDGKAEIEGNPAERATRRSAVTAKSLPASSGAR